MKFIEGTTLLDHPAVRQAYDHMKSGCNPANTTIVKKQIRAAELLSTSTKNADPDAIAACIFMFPEALKEFSAKAAEYAAQYYAVVEAKNTNPLSEGAKQVLFAQSIVALKDTVKKINDGTAWKYSITSDEIDGHKKSILAAADSTEQPLVQAALKQLQVTSTALEDLVRKTQAAAAFEKAGLPEHPTLREAYALLRTQETKGDRLFAHKSDMGARLVKILVETGASSDPDVLGAALLNQYGEKRDGALSKKFSPRLVKIYRGTTPFNRASRKSPPSAETTLILQAIRVYSLEADLQDYPQCKGKYDTFGALENMEYTAKNLAEVISDETPPGLKARMEKAIASANAVMNAPKNQKIRKPGTPPRDPGW